MYEAGVRVHNGEVWYGVLPGQMTRRTPTWRMTAERATRTARMWGDCRYYHLYTIVYMIHCTQTNMLAPSRTWQWSLVIEKVALERAMCWMGGQRRTPLEPASPFTGLYSPQSASRISMKDALARL